MPPTPSSGEPPERADPGSPQDAAVETTSQHAPLSAGGAGAPAHDGDQPVDRVAAGARRSARTAQAVALLMALGLEALPVTAWLFVFAGITGALDSVALPFWWIVVVLLAAWAVAAELRRLPRAGRWSRLAERGVKVLAVAGWLLTVLISMALSPAAYWGTSQNEWLPMLAADLQSGNGRLGADVGLAFLTAYLWWRGLLLGRLALRRDRVYVRFLWGLAAIVMAIAGAAALAGTIRSLVTTALGLLLPAEVFVGLVGIALAQLLDAEEERGSRRQLRGGQQERVAGSPRSAITRAWLVSALGISGSIVLGALALALIVSYDSVRGLVTLFQPLVSAVGTLIEWLIEGIAFLLFLLLDGPLSWIKEHVQPTRRAINPPQPTRSPTQSYTPHTLPLAWQIAGRWVLIALALLALVLVLVLRRFRDSRQQPEYEEERETLDIATALGKQLANLLTGLRGRERAAGAEVEALPEGSVRLLYREMLERAATVGYARRASETPDEYAQRLRANARQEVPGEAPPTVLPDFDQAMTALTNAYDPARYRSSASPADSEEMAPPAVVAAHHTVLEWLASVAARARAGTSPPDATAGSARLRARGWLPRRR